MIFAIAKSRIVLKNTVTAIEEVRAVMKSAIALNVTITTSTVIHKINQWKGKSQSRKLN